MMRLWSLHPKYLDYPKGLGGLWNEALQAQTHLMADKGLCTAPKMHRNHPQLERFRYPGCTCRTPLELIGGYLRMVWFESQKHRNKTGRKPNYKRELIYKFTNTSTFTDVDRIVVPAGQVLYEWELLIRKLTVRDPSKCSDNLKDKITKLEGIKLNPVFTLGFGNWNIAEWEKGDLE